VAHHLLGGTAGPSPSRGPTIAITPKPPLSGRTESDRLERRAGRDRSARDVGCRHAACIGWSSGALGGNASDTMTVAGVACRTSPPGATARRLFGTFGTSHASAASPCRRR
jgi:hypothetical protein